mmetsp:Transcript_14268/g.17990  ORF Transcript_14268/g.17990 Transcript_14268/m.17990 type:complete len:254 (+) Transcript_14268:688-1449(+)
MYCRFPTTTSTNSSTLISSLASKSALTILYSLIICIANFSGSGPSFVKGTVDANFTPPLVFFRNVTSGGRLFIRIPTVSNSCSSISRCRFNPSLPASSTIKIASQLRAHAITSFPRPFPCAAPSIIPGKSRTWTLLPLYCIVPGMHVKVVNSYAAASDWVAVRVPRRVDFPTEGKPMRAMRASPRRLTSKPSPPPPEEEFSTRSSLRSLASLAFSVPRWYSVALFFWVRAISASISFIFSITPMVASVVVIKL